MRKRITCKIIKSVPLDTANNWLSRSRVINPQQPKINNIGSSIYTPCLVVKKPCTEDGYMARFLDCCA